MFRTRKLDKAVANQEYKGFVVEKKPKSIVSEAYRTLRTNIQYSSFDKEIKAIVVTSAEAAEGKSTVSGNLALSFAQNEKRVIIVDCDLRKPSVHKNFKLSNLAGLSEVLIGKAKLEEVIQSRNENLDILTSGKIPPNPSEMLSSAAMTNLIEKLKEHGIKEDMLYERTLLTAPKIETLVGKKNFREWVGDMVVPIPGKPTLVHESDKREAITKRTAEDIFGKNNI